MGATDGADLPGSEFLSGEFEETTVPSTSSLFLNLGQRRLRVLKKRMEAADYVGTTFGSAFARGWYARMVGAKVRFAEMAICAFLSLVGVSSLSAGLGGHAWAWALSAEVFGAISHTERVCGHPREKTVLDVVHLVLIASAWAVAAVVGERSAEKTPLFAHLGYHTFVRTALPIILVCLRGAGVVDAFVVSQPERVIDLLTREDTTLVPRAGATYVINTPPVRPSSTGRKLHRRYIEYRSNNGWFKSVGGINEAEKEGIFFFYGVPYYAHESVMVTPGRDTPELIVGELDGALFRMGYTASVLGALRNCLTICILVFRRDLYDTMEQLVLALPLLGEAWGVPWALMRHSTWDADWMLSFLSPSHVLWSWHYEDRPKRRGLLWAKATSGLLTLLLSASSPYFGNDQEEGHGSAELSFFLGGGILTLSALDWRYAPLLWLCSGFAPEVWTLISARDEESAVGGFIPAIVALADLCVTMVPLISITSALGGARPGGLLWWPEECPCRNNVSWAHRFGWLDIVGIVRAGSPSPSEPLFPNLFGRCRCDGTSVNCGVLVPELGEGALHAPEGVSQFNFVMHLFGERDVEDHCTVLRNTTGSYATVPAFRLGNMRNVE